jgi:16S rRNA (guanine(966)-N(2))-methyltransferase RsmD
MVRQALFSSLAARVPGCRFLDLYAGSGAVGLEGWSRGAAAVCWVERNPRVARVLRQNVTELCGGSGACRVVEADALRFLAQGDPGGAFDLVFADPPYETARDAGWWAELLAALRSGPCLAADGRVVIESAAGAGCGPTGSDWDVTLDRNYGGSRLLVLARANP